MEIIGYNSFTTEKGKGNPAGVVFLEGTQIDIESMQQMAKAVGFNETVFVNSNDGKFRFRFFTPGHEVDLCGHATIAAVGLLNDKKLINASSFEVATNIGDIEIRLEMDENLQPIVLMSQGQLATREFKGSKSNLCESLGITLHELDSSLPIVYGSTGIWTLLVPIK